MVTLDCLKKTLRQSATTLASASAPTQPLSHSQYDAGFKILRQSSEQIYHDFIIPQLSLLLAPLFESRSHISVLEVGPGPESVLDHLPDLLKRKIKRYVALEPNKLFCTKLTKWFCSDSGGDYPLPCLEMSPDIRQTPFTLDSDPSISVDTDEGDSAEKFDVVLFCHSMYGMKPKRKFIERALQMVIAWPEGGLVVVFHRDGTLDLDGLICHQTSNSPAGFIRIADDDEILDEFAPFVAGFVMQDVETDMTVKSEWRKVCRTFGQCEKGSQDYILFSAPNIMAALTQEAASLPELMALVPIVNQDMKIKNPEARCHRPAAICRPTEIAHVQHCVRWALDHKTSLTVIGGSHSGHCLQPNVVSIDMSFFDQIHIPTIQEDTTSGTNPGTLIVVEAGCKSGDIIRKAMKSGVTIPLGSRPSVGAGLWLQGGIGHLSRLYGLTCDAIVGAVVVSISTGQILCIGHVPDRHRPADAVRPENEEDLMWALKGAGTNFGIVISVTFKTFAAPVFVLHKWIKTFSNPLDARLVMSDLDELIAKKLPSNLSVDVYLYWDIDHLCMGVITYDCSTYENIHERQTLDAGTSLKALLDKLLGPEDSFKVVDGFGLFETELYMSVMHGGHGTSKTSSFKRCLFLNNIGTKEIVDILIASIKARPSPFCYFHLLQGGKSINEVADDATPFGCRDWEYACVVTGVWLRNEDGTDIARAAVQWVYNVTENLLPRSCGVYGADLGPDPRDINLVAKAFGPNLSRLARLKHISDPFNVLPHACPLPKARLEQQTIVLVTGEHGVGKDYCADVWVSVLNSWDQKNLRARVVSISDATKHEYAAATGANFERLLQDRAYKEEHRSALSAFFQDQIQHRPRLPEEHFMRLVQSASDVDALLITGIREEAPVAALSHLVPDCRLFEVRVKANKKIRDARRGYQSDKKDHDEIGTHNDHHASLIFDNDTTGIEAAKCFCESYLYPLFHEDLRRLARMVRSVPNFPNQGVIFRDVLGVTQQSGGLALSTDLLENNFSGDWANVDRIVCCETGGFIYASALSTRVDIPLALIREAGKVPPPTISVTKSPSYISSSTSRISVNKRFEMGRIVMPRGASVLVVDDVLASGKTLRAVLHLLSEAGISSDDVYILVVAEFPMHRGREFLRQSGFGGAKIRSLLVFDGA